MPYVNVKIAKTGVTADQKGKIIKGVTQVLVDVLGKDPEAILVIIDEVDTDNLGKGGESVSLRRSKTVPAA